MKRDIAKTVDEKSPRSESGLAKGTRERPLPRIVQIPVSSRVTMEFTVLHYLRLKIWKTGGIDARFSGFARACVSIAVTKLRGNRRQTGPLTNLHATINNVKANSRIERRSRTPSAHHHPSLPEGERVFSLSSPRRSDECSHAMRPGARERGWLPPHTPPHIPPSNAIYRDRGRKLRESLHLGGDFLFKKQDEDERPSPGSRVSRTRATRRLFSTLPLSRSIFSYR